MKRQLFSINGLALVMLFVIISVGIVSYGLVLADHELTRLTHENEYLKALIEANIEEQDKLNTRLTELEDWAGPGPAF